MTTWAENLIKARTGNANKVEFIDAISHWLGTAIADETEGMYEAVSRRVVWVFPDDYAFAVGTFFNPVFYHLSTEIKFGDVIPLSESLQKDWTYSSQANGWASKVIGREFPKAQEILNLVELLTEAHGEPNLVLPWGSSWTDSVHYEEGDEEIRETMFHLATAVLDGTLEKSSPWKMVKMHESDALSYYSDFSKFERFLEKVRDQKLVILELDQHCAACSSGTYDSAVKADPELEGKEIFTTWGQNSQGFWHGDGYICFDVEIENADVEKELTLLAEEIGLDMEFDEEEWSASGRFWYES